MIQANGKTGLLRASPAALRPLITCCGLPPLPSLLPSPRQCKAALILSLSSPSSRALPVWPVQTTVGKGSAPYQLHKSPLQAMIPNTLISSVSVIMLCEIVIPRFPFGRSHEAYALSPSLSLLWAMDSAVFKGICL